MITFDFRTNADLERVCKLFDVQFNGYYETNTGRTEMWAHIYVQGLSQADYLLECFGSLGLYSIVSE